jgi:hypothetical protein
MIGKYSSVPGIRRFGIRSRAARRQTRESRSGHHCEEFAAVDRFFGHGFVSNIA